MQMFQPFQIKNKTIRNRIVLPPMCMYTADGSGRPNVFHYTHYVSRAIGGVGLIIQEATAVHPDGRLTLRDLGIWEDGQIEHLRNIVSACQAYGAVMAVQINHAGRKAAVEINNRYAPSAIRYSASDRNPSVLTEEQIGQIVQNFKNAALRANTAGYGALEVHGAHGFLIHQFLSPLSNQRNDRYGGNLKGRVLILKEILEAVHSVWPADKPVLLRVSATDYNPQGITPDGMVQIINEVKGYIDIVDVSSGGLLPDKVVSFPGYQTPLAEKIRNECAVPVITAGLIQSGEMVEEILNNRRADLVGVGRGLLRNPNWVLEAAHKSGEKGYIPTSYETAFGVPLVF